MMFNKSLIPSYSELGHFGNRKKNSEVMLFSYVGRVYHLNKETYFLQTEIQDKSELNRVFPKALSPIYLLQCFPLSCSIEVIDSLLALTKTIILFSFDKRLLFGHFKILKGYANT